MISVAANDLELFEFAVYTPEWILALVYNIATIIVSYFFLGPTTLVYLAIIVFLLVLAFLLALIPKRLRESIGIITDNRVKMLTNIIDGASIVKLYGWD